MNTSKFQTFIPIAGDHELKKFVLDVDQIMFDWGFCEGDHDTIIFPNDTPLPVIREFLEKMVIPEVGPFEFEAVACMEDKSCVYANIFPALSPETQAKIENLISDLANSLRKV